MRNLTRKSATPAIDRAAFTSGSMIDTVHTTRNAVTANHIPYRQYSMTCVSSPTTSPPVRLVLIRSQLSANTTALSPKFMSILPNDTNTTGDIPCIQTPCSCKFERHLVRLIPQTQTQLTALVVTLNPANEAEPSWDVIQRLSDHFACIVGKTVSYYSAFDPIAMERRPISVK